MNKNELEGRSREGLSFDKAPQPRFPELKQSRWDLAESFAGGISDILSGLKGVNPFKSWREILIVSSLLTACSSSVESSQPPVDSSPTPVVSMEVEETPTLTPTELPNPMVEASSNLPEGSGVITEVDGQWIFDSQLESGVGSDVPVEMVQRELENGEAQDMIVLSEHNDWPLFVRSESGEWETFMEYFDVNERFLDVNGNEIPISTVSDIPSGDHPVQYSDIYPVVVGGVFLGEDGYFRIPVAFSLDGEEDSPMCRYNAIAGPEGWSLIIGDYTTRGITFHETDNISELLPVGDQVGLGLPRSFIDEAAYWDFFDAEVRDSVSPELLRYFLDSFENLEENSLIITSLEEGECVYSSGDERPELWSVTSVGVSADKLEE